MNNRGGYRIKTELKEDLFDIKTLAEVAKSAAKTSETIGKEDRRSIISSSNKIKGLIDKWIGVG